MFGISAKEIKRKLAVLLALALILTSNPISGFASDVGNMLAGMMRSGGDSVSGGNATTPGGNANTSGGNGNISGGNGNVSGGDVSGGNVSSGDFIVSVAGDGQVEVTQKAEGVDEPVSLGTINGTAAGITETIVPQLGEVAVKITPASDTDEGWRSYIAKAVNHAEENVLNANADVYKTVDYQFELTEEHKEETLEVVFGKEYLFKVVSTEGGTVSLSVNNESTDYTKGNNKQWVDSAANVKLDIKADTTNHYRIESVFINGDAPTGGNELEEYSETYSLSGITPEATTIEVNFVKVYSITVNVAGNGSASVTENNTNTPLDNNVYINKWNGNVTFNAKPDTGYRVTSVKFGNEEPETFEENDKTYGKELTGVGEYEVTVEFKPNRYTLTVEDFEHATLTTNVTGNQVEYGKVITGELVPDEGFAISGVQYVPEGEEAQELTLTPEGNEGGVSFKTATVKGNGKLVITVVDSSKPRVSLSAAKSTGAHYNADVSISVAVNDDKTSSGIKSVTYKVTGDSASETVTMNSGNEAGTWNGRFDISKDKYDFNEIKVVVTVEDMAGNKSEATYEFTFDTTAPEINVVYSGSEAVDTGSEKDYFTGTRTATVQITESALKNEDTEIELDIKATNAQGKTIVLEKEISLSEWKQSTEDSSTYEATVIFEEEANYAWSITCVDPAGNKTVRDYEEFVIDTSKPTGTIAVNGEQWSSVAAERSKIISTDAKITSTQSDNISPIKDVKYYLVKGSDAEKVLSDEDLSKLSADVWTTFDTVEGLTVSASSQFVVYLQITDWVGRITYLSTADIVADDVRPNISTIVPETSTTFNGLGLSNGNVNVSVSVSDPGENGVSTGISSATYTVYSNGVATESGTVGSGGFTVDASKNNSNNVSVEVSATDRAGNRSSSSSATFMIDITAPVITVSYDNNAPDSGNYYNAARVATVSIRERNFDPTKVVVNITNSDGAVPSISAWTSSGTGDNTTHVATIAYTEDGDYTFDISYTDAAGNAATGINYAEGTTSPDAFTIDRTTPAINVLYDNNVAQNEKYFSAERTATITIIEHNFAVDRVVLTQTARLDGVAITVPEIRWTHNGDTHEGRIVYDADGDYTFAIAMTDMAGNQNSDVDYGNSVAAQDFTVDMILSAPAIEGVEDGHSYKDVIVPSIIFEDVNYDSSEIQLLRTRNGEINVDVTEEFITGMLYNEQGAQGTNDTFAETADNDGIYTLIVKVKDKAGNEKTEKIVFTVNRFGSVYAFNDYLASLQEAYVQAVDGSIIITEYNPDKLVEDSIKVEITKDGTPLTDVAFTVNTVAEANGETGWYQYEYVIDASNFAADGIYKLSVSSEDAAGNKPETENFEDCTVLFRVDTVDAEITSIRGLEEGIVNAESKTVEFDVFDAIGLKKVTVYVNDTAVDVYEEFDNIINFSGTLTLEEGANQTVRLVVEDLAGNVTDTSSETFVSAFAFNDTITISTNSFIRWYANKPLFFGSIAGVVALVGGSAAAVVLRRRKKSK